jgi:hypothetical membrane protein
MKLNVLAVGFIVAVIIIAQLVVPEPYDWKVNTISELSAQGYPKKWIMQVGFIGFGALLALNSFRNYRVARTWQFREIPLSIYALAILLSGIFCTQPFIDGISYSEIEARLHTLFATTAGIGLSIALLIFTLTDKESRRKFIHTTFLLLVLVLSLLFGLFPAYAGIIQRSLYFVGFSWLVFMYNSSPAASDRDTIEL